jgi:hypothetical protein
LGYSCGCLVVAFAEDALGEARRTSLLGNRVNKGVDPEAFGQRLVRRGDNARTTQAARRLPPYLASEPNAPAQRRPDGTVVDRFGARGMAHETPELEAFGDLLGAIPLTPSWKALQGEL